jgi:hypothetical protein
MVGLFGVLPQSKDRVYSSDAVFLIDAVFAIKEALAQRTLFFVIGARPLMSGEPVRRLNRREPGVVFLKNDGAL